MDETQFEERVTWGDDSGHAATIQAQNMEVTREETIEADLDQSQSNGQQGKLKRPWLVLIGTVQKRPLPSARVVSFSSSVHMAIS